MQFRSVCKCLYLKHPFQERNIYLQCTLKVILSCLFWVEMTRLQQILFLASEYKGTLCNCFRNRYLYCKYLKLLVPSYALRYNDFSFQEHEQHYEAICFASVPYHLQSHLRSQILFKYM